MKSVEDTVRAFVAAINAHDTERLVSLCAPQHRFVDSLGTVLAGRDRTRSAWSGYFDLFPNYTIEVDSLVVSGDLVLMTGWASGATWRIPAAWRAEVRGGLIDAWQVYADNKPVYEHLGRAGS